MTSISLEEALFAITKMTTPAILAEEPRGSYCWGGTFEYSIPPLSKMVKLKLVEGFYRTLLQLPCLT
jgi:hypothetical protein